MRNERNARIVELLNNRQTDLTVFMDNVHKPHNLAAIVRTCDAVGIGHVHAVYPHDYIHQCGGTASGSNRWVDTHTYPTLSAGIDIVKAQGMRVMAAHFSDRAVDFRSIDYTQPTCILVGAEKYGVSDEAADAADEHLLIPMLGMVQSLNVSVATALILYEIQRQRANAQLYGTRKISDEEFELRRFTWLHPEIKDFCDQQGIRYPLLDADGEIEDPEWHQLRQQIAG